MYQRRSRRTCRDVSGKLRLVLACRLPLTHVGSAKRLHLAVEDDQRIASKNQESGDMK
jgi:hypothetical protein